MCLKHSKIVDKNKERGLYQIYLMAFKTRVSYSSLCRRKNKASLVVQMVKNLLAMQETQVQSLVWEHPLEKGMATHSSTLVLRIPWTEEPGRLQYMGLQRVYVTEPLTLLCKKHTEDYITLQLHFPYHQWQWNMKGNSCHRGFYSTLFLSLKT